MRQPVRFVRFATLCLVLCFALAGPVPAARIAGASLCPEFQNVPGRQTWIRDTPIPSLTFSTTQPEPSSTLFYDVKGLPRGLTPWAWPTNTKVGGISRLDFAVSGTPEAAGSGTVTVEASAFNNNIPNSPIYTSQISFDYTVLDNGSPRLTGIPAAQVWERGVQAARIGGIRIEKGTGGNILGVAVRGLPPGLNAALHPDPSGVTGGVGRVDVEIDGTPSATTASGRIRIEATAANGTVSVEHFSYRMQDIGDASIRGVPTSMQEWAPGEPVAPLTIVVDKNADDIAGAEITGLPTGIAAISTDGRPTQITFVISGDPAAEMSGTAGTVEIAAHTTAGGASYASFGYAVAPKGVPAFSGLPGEIQRWRAGEPIVPVALRIRSRHGQRIVSSDVFAVPAGLSRSVAHVSSMDVWIALEGTPRAAGQGAIEVTAGTENGMSAAESFRYEIFGDGGSGGGTPAPRPPGENETPEALVPIGDLIRAFNDAGGAGDGSTLTPALRLPSGIAQGSPVTHVRSGDAAFEPRTAPNPGGAGGNPPGVLLPGFVHASGSFSASIGLGEDASGDMLALSYEMRLSGKEPFAAWPGLDESGRLALLDALDARLVYEYGPDAVTGQAQQASKLSGASGVLSVLAGRDGVLSWREAAAAGVVRFTNTGLVLQYAVTDREAEPFAGGGFMIIPDGRRDGRLSDPVWLLIRQETGPETPEEPASKGGGGCGGLPGASGAWGALGLPVAATGAACALRKRRKAG